GVMMLLEDPGFVENHERAVQRGQRYVEALLQFGDRFRPLQPDQGGHEGPASGCVADVVVRQSAAHCLMQFGLAGDGGQLLLGYTENDSHSTQVRILTRSLRLSVLVFLAAAVGACGSNRADDDRLLVVATTNVIGDVVSDLVGDQGQVEVLMEAGVDPHAFSPSAAQVGLINRADLVVANGLLLEAGLHDSLVSAAEDGIIVLELAPELDPI